MTMNYAGDLSAVTSTATTLLLQAVAAVNGSIHVTETVRQSDTNEYRWTASATPSLSFMRIDGKQTRQLHEDDELHDADDLDGYGRTRDEALTDLWRHLQRVTFAIVNLMEWDQEHDRPRFSTLEVAWDGEKLAPIPRAAA